MSPMKMFQTNHALKAELEEQARITFPERIRRLDEADEADRRAFERRHQKWLANRVDLGEDIS